MKVRIDYEHIFFDRYMLDKESEAIHITELVLKEKGFEYIREGVTFDVKAVCADEEMEAVKLFELLKREFFIIAREISQLPCQNVDKSTELVKYMRENYLNVALTVEEICEEINLSRNEADNFMKKEYNVTISEYIRNLRVEKASALLKEGFSVAECCDLCGFGSVKTMQRAFKSVYNATPSEWRAYNLDSKDAK